MTASPEAAGGAANRRRSAIDTVAGLLSAAAITIGAVGIAWHPFRLVPVAVVLALVSAGIGGRHAMLARVAVFWCIACWMIGMIVAVVTKNPIY